MVVIVRLSTRCGDIAGARMRYVYNCDSEMGYGDDYDSELVYGDDSEGE